MSEIIAVRFPDISGDVSGHTAFVRNAAGSLLNTGGDTILEIQPGLWTFTLDEDRVANTDYFVAIYSGGAEIAEELVYDGTLYAGQFMVDVQFSSATLTLVFGTVGASPAPTTSSFTVSEIQPAGGRTNQWTGRIIIFNNNTATAALRGQATDVLTVSGTALPILTFTPLTDAPAAGDKFTIV